MCQSIRIAIANDYAKKCIHVGISELLQNFEQIKFAYIFGEK